MPLKCLCSFLMFFCVDKRWRCHFGYVLFERSKSTKKTAADRRVRNFVSLNFCMCAILLMGQCHRWHFIVYLWLRPRKQACGSQSQTSDTSLRDAIPHQQNLSHAKLSEEPQVANICHTSVFSGRYFIKIPIVWKLESLRSLEVILFLFVKSNQNNPSAGNTSVPGPGVSPPSFTVPLSPVPAL